LELLRSRDLKSDLDGDLGDANANRRGPCEVSRMNDRARTDDRAGWYEGLEDLRDDDFCRSCSNLGDGVGRNAEAAGSVVIDGMRMRVRGRECSTEQHKRHAKYAEQNLPAAG
jgi:hypothetical protein